MFIIKKKINGIHSKGVKDKSQQIKEEEEYYSLFPQKSNRKTAKFEIQQFSIYCGLFSKSNFFTNIAWRSEGCHFIAVTLGPVT